MIRTKIKEVLKEVLFNTPLKSYFTPRYLYYFTVPQLLFLCKCIDDVKDIEGGIAEVGCFSGRTTIFLNKFMDAKNINKIYYAIDTFSSFVIEDIDYEVKKGHKKRSWYTNPFQINKKKWFDYTMQLNNIKRVVSIQADVNKYNLSSLGPLSFILLDVDLYRPTKKSLKELFEILTNDGIMIVDDCDSENTVWNGSYEAYKEFMDELNKPCQILYNKLGIVKK
jgi:O-methyltransferase